MNKGQVDVDALVHGRLNPAAPHDVVLVLDDYHVVGSLDVHTQLAFLMDPDGKPLALLPLDDPSTDADEGAPAAVAADLAKWVK